MADEGLRRGAYRNWRRKHSHCIVLHKGKQVRLGSGTVYKAQVPQTQQSWYKKFLLNCLASGHLQSCLYRAPVCVWLHRRIENETKLIIQRIVAVQSLLFFSRNSNSFLMMFIHLSSNHVSRLGSQNYQ